MLFDRGGPGRRIADGRAERSFIWELRPPLAATVVETV